MSSQSRRARKDIEPPPATLTIPELEEDRGQVPHDAAAAPAATPTPPATAAAAPLEGAGEAAPTSEDPVAEADEAARPTKALDAADAPDSPPHPAVDAAAEAAKPPAAPSLAASAAARPLPPAMSEAKFKRLSWVVSVASVALMAVGLEALTEGHIARAVLFIGAAMLLFAYPTFVRALDDPETIRRRAHKKRAKAYRKRARRERKKDQNKVVEPGPPDGESSDD